LRRSCGNVVRRQLPLAGFPFARSNLLEDARVFSPCSRDTDSSCGMCRAFLRTAQWLRAPCADRLKERTNNPYHGRALSLLRALGPSLSGLVALSEPGTLRRNQGLADFETRSRTPSAGPMRVSVLHPRGSIEVGRVGSFRELALVSRARSTLAAKQMMNDPVRISHLYRRSTPFPRSASRLPLGTAPRCLVPASTTDVTSRAPGKTSPSETRRTFR